jgi:hypothetical protein
VVVERSGGIIEIEMEEDCLSAIDRGDFGPLVLGWLKAVEFSGGELA